MSTQLELNEKIIARCKELEHLNATLRSELEDVRASKARTDFTLTPIVNSETGKVELFSVVYIISDNNVVPMLRRGRLSDDDVVTWTAVENVYI